MKTKNFKLLIKEIVSEILTQLHESQNGEWWIDGGMAVYADGDIGDSNHEAHAIEAISRQIYDHFLGDFHGGEYVGYLKDYKDELYQHFLENNRLSKEEVEIWEDDPEEIIVKKLLEDGEFSDKNQAKIAVSIAWSYSSNIDSRDYAMKYLGWKRMTSSNKFISIQTWFLREQDLIDIKRGIFDALGEIEEENDDEESKYEVEIEVMSNNRSFGGIPLDILEKATIRDIILYDRRKAWMKEQTDYLQIGHNPKSTIWAFIDGEFKKYPESVYGTTHYKLGLSRKADFLGRYDPEKKAISIVNNKNSYSEDTEVPPEIIRRLKFEFGDDNRILLFCGGRQNI